MADDPRRPGPADDLDEGRALTKTGGPARPVPDAADPADLDAIQAMARGITPRYEDGSWSRSGGMGTLNEVHDRLLGRVLVRKRPRRQRRDDAGFRAFVHEAQVTAALSHPSIVPLYELLYDDEGYSYLMPRIEGVTLHEVLKGIAAADDATQRRFGLSRLLGIFRTVCGAVAHAHARGVVHRDLKPDQIMLGEHDEVLVVDWGLAAQFGEPRDDLVGMGGGSLSTSSIRSGQTILQGVHGSPMYQPPERLVMGAIPADPVQDVYSLGAILYHLLTLQPPVGLEHPDEDGSAYLERIRLEIAQVTPPSRACWRAPLDPVWDRICLCCLAAQPADRYADAGEVYREVEQALSDLEEREKRRERATACVLRGNEGVERLEATRRELFAARELRLKLQDSIPFHAPVTEKRPLWAAESREEQLERAFEEDFAAAERQFERALDHDRESIVARSALADLHMARLAQAESDGHHAAQAYHRARLASFDDGVRIAALARGGSLVVEAQPQDVDVRVAQLEEVERRWTPQDWSSLPSPTEPSELAPGRYQVEIRAPGRSTARYALLVERGAYLRLAPRLPARDAVPEGFAYLPAGPCLMGGDPMVPDAGPIRRVDMPDVALAILPVTFAEYLVFLDSLSEDVAEQHLPRDPVDSFPYCHLEEGRWGLPEADARGERFDRGFPALSVRADDAEAYAAWITARDRRRYRLPTRSEWEYAARSGDGRCFPWGDRFEPTYCWAAQRQRGRPTPGVAGRCPEDVSPTGVRDLAGGVGDWLADVHGADGTLRAVGGGAGSPASATAGSRGASALRPRPAATGSDSGSRSIWTDSRVEGGSGAPRRGGRGPSWPHRSPWRAKPNASPAPRRHCHGPSSQKPAGDSSSSYARSLSL